MSLLMSTRADDGLPQQNAEINITPFIDVVLVLLIIFMVTAPLALNEIPLRLPPSTAQPVQLPQSPLVLSLDRDGQLALDGEAITREALGALLEAQLSADPQRVVYLRADTALAYGEVSALLAELGVHGVVRIALLTEPTPR